MNIAAQGRAMSMTGKANEAKGAQKVLEFLKIAETHGQDALTGPLVSGQLLSSYALCLSRMLQVQKDLGETEERAQLEERTEGLFKQALAFSQSDYSIRIKYATWKESLNVVEAHYQWARALDMVPATKIVPYAKAYLEFLKRAKLFAWAAELEHVLDGFDKLKKSPKSPYPLRKPLNQIEKKEVAK
jgi:hypothetical protein